MLEISGVLKVWGIIAISKIDFISFSSTERIIQNREKLKTIQNLISSFGNHFAINSIKSRIFVLFSLKIYPFHSLEIAVQLLIIPTYLQTIMSRKQ